MGIDVKLIELRDSATFIPAIAIRVWRDREADPSHHWMIGAAGYGSEPLVLFGRLDGGGLHYDPYKGPQNRTWFYSHEYLRNHWDDIPDGGIVDVRVILGETTELPESERQYYQ